MVVVPRFSPDLQLYHSETLELMLQRWSKLERDFRMKNGRYDISKIPDIYDCIKYDSQHNASVGLEDTLELFRLSRALADIVIPQVRSLSFSAAWHGLVLAPSPFRFDKRVPVDQNAEEERFGFLWFQEYGINKAEKLDIAQAYCVPLMKKIYLDLQRTHEDEAVNKLHPL